MIIAFCGAMCSEKDTLCDELSKKLPNTTKLAFADSLKDELDEIIINIKKFYDTNNSLYFYELIKEKNLKLIEVSNLCVIFEPLLKLSINFNSRSRYQEVRKALQYLGTDIRRKQNPNYWVNKMKQKLEQNKDKTILISDARFLNEIEMLEELDAIIICLDIDEKTRKARLKKRDGLKNIPYELKYHKSETDFRRFKNYDLVLTEKDDLKTEINKILKVIGERNETN